MPEPIPVTDGDPEEFADLDRIMVEDGIAYDDHSLKNQRWLERASDSPATLYDEPVPWKFWKLVHHHIKEQIRSTPVGLDFLRYKREVALAWVKSLLKNRVNAQTPLRAQLDFYDLLTIASPTNDADEDVMRCFREAVYIVFNNEYMARGIG